MDKKFEVIMCIVNNGYSDVVMSAAKEAGARGGTILNAKSSASEEAQLYYGFAIHDEKEIVMIVAPRQHTEKILKAIYSEAGVSTLSQGIIFTLPISYVTGFAMIGSDE